MDKFDIKTFDLKLYDELKYCRRNHHILHMSNFGIDLSRRDGRSLNCNVCIHQLSRQNYIDDLQKRKLMKQLNNAKKIEKKDILKAERKQLKYDSIQKYSDEIKNNLLQF
jgi:signal recognition particle subunit SEC65